MRRVAEERGFILSVLGALCGISMEKEGPEKYNERSCTNGESEVGDGRKECERCGRWITKGIEKRGHVRGEGERSPGSAKRM